MHLHRRLYEKYGSSLLSKALRKERVRWLDHVLRMTFSVIRWPKFMKRKCEADCPQKTGKGHKQGFQGSRDLMGGSEVQRFEQIGVEEDRRQLCWPQVV